EGISTENGIRNGTDFDNTKSPVAEKRAKEPMKFRRSGKSDMYHIKFLPKEFPRSILKKIVVVKNSQEKRHSISSHPKSVKHLINNKASLKGGPQAFTQISDWGDHREVVPDSTTFYTTSLDETVSREYEKRKKHKDHPEEIKTSDMNSENLSNRTRGNYTSLHPNQFHKARKVPRSTDSLNVKNYPEISSRKIEKPHQPFKYKKIKYPNDAMVISIRIPESILWQLAKEAVNGIPKDQISPVPKGNLILTSEENTITQNSTPFEEVHRILQCLNQSSDNTSTSQPKIDHQSEFYSKNKMSDIANDNALIKESLTYNKISELQTEEREPIKDLSMVQNETKKLLEDEIVLQKELLKNKEFSKHGEVVRPPNSNESVGKTESLVKEEKKINQEAKLDKKIKRSFETLSGINHEKGNHKRRFNKLLHKLKKAKRKRKMLYSLRNISPVSEKKSDISQDSDLKETIDASPEFQPELYLNWIWRPVMSKQMSNNENYIDIPDGEESSLNRNFKVDSSTDGDESSMSKNFNENSKDMEWLSGLSMGKMQNGIFHITTVSSDGLYFDNTTQAAFIANIVESEKKERERMNDFVNGLKNLIWKMIDQRKLSSRNKKILYTAALRKLPEILRKHVNEIK
ncbi:hypothetical protein NPIL_667581, partial [Nephila pilipes]